MKIIVSKEAHNWFKREMDIETGDAIRFYVRYGGSSPFHEGFSLGMNREEPHQVGVTLEQDGVLFYIEKDDEWFFNEHDLYVHVDEVLDELAYEYKQSL